MEEKNINLSLSDGIFTVRAVPLILSQNHLLVAKSSNYDCFYTVGGGVHAYETSADAVVREVLEETGCRMDIERLLFVQERFFCHDNVRHHEIAFFYLMKNTDIFIENGDATDCVGEHLEWIPIHELPGVNLVPAFLKTALQNIPEEVVHIISEE